VARREVAGPWDPGALDLRDVSLHDPSVVRAEYSTEAGLLARRAAFDHAEGPNAPEMVFDAVAEVRPQNCLEVGCGPGELAARVQERIGADVIAIDISPRMVELARGRGVDAREGDVQHLPFGNGEFDCAVAAWMLYHVSDVEQALDELARVIRPGGRLVAVTNGLDHMGELRELLGLPPRMMTTFSRENGGALLGSRFTRVEERDASGTVLFPNRSAVLAYVQASISMFEGVTDVPEFVAPLAVRRTPVVFVADK
jgi:SAM-dependent methyltransferase